MCDFNQITVTIERVPTASFFSDAGGSAPFQGGHDGGSTWEAAEATGTCTDTRALCNTFLTFRNALQKGFEFRKCFQTRKFGKSSGGLSAGDGELSVAIQECSCTCSAMHREACHFARKLQEAAGRQRYAANISGGATQTF